MTTKIETRSIEDDILRDQMIGILESDSPDLQLETDILKLISTSISANASIFWSRTEKFCPLVAIGCDQSDMEKAANDPEYQAMLERTAATNRQLVLHAPRADNSSQIDLRDVQIFQPVELKEGMASRCVVHFFLKHVSVAGIDAIRSRLITCAANLRWREHLREHSKLSSEVCRLQGREELIARLVRYLDHEKLAIELVNELPLYLQCDRVSFMEIIGSQCRLVATSGQPVFDRRSNVVKRKEQLCKVALRSCGEFWSDDQDMHNDEVKAAWDRYAGYSHAQSTAILFLVSSKTKINPTEDQLLAEIVSEGVNDRSRTIGAIVIDSMDSALDQTSILHRWNRISKVVTDCVDNAQTHNRLFLMPLWKKLGQFSDLYRGKPRNKAIGITSAIGLTILTLLFVQTDFLVRCEGVIQPVQQHPVFAQQEGTIVEILANDGDMVEAGQVLLGQRNATIEDRHVELDGKVALLTDKLNNLIYQRSRYKLVNDRKDRGEDLDSETMAVESELEYARKQLTVVTSQLQELEVRSPLKGVVYAWNVDRRLLDRPVSAGTRLFTVAAVDSDWELQLKVPDNRANYVYQAWDGATPVKMSYVLSSAPGTTFEASVKHVAPNLDVDAEEGAVLPVSAEVCIAKLVDDRMIRPGTTVVGKINCGRASIAYCKSYEFLDWCRRTYFMFVY